jgi:hypothetical protein
MRRAVVLLAFTLTVATAAGTVATARGHARVRLTGRLLFTRAGGRFGDETVYTAHADGAISVGSRATARRAALVGQPMAARSFSPQWRETGG